MGGCSCYNAALQCTTIRTKLKRLRSRRAVSAEIRLGNTSRVNPSESRELCRWLRECRLYNVPIASCVLQWRTRKCYDSPSVPVGVGGRR